MLKLMLRPVANCYRTERDGVCKYDSNQNRSGLPGCFSPNDECIAWSMVELRVIQRLFNYLDRD